MSQLPALPLWIDAWVSDTAHLSRAERGLYHDLLVLMWKTPGCRVPNDLGWISRKLRCSPEEVGVLEVILSEFCQSTGHWVTQKRLQKEFDFVCRRSKKQSNTAKSRWEKEKDICRGNAPTPTPTPTQKEEGLSKDSPSAPTSPELPFSKKAVLLDMGTAQAAVAAYNAVAEKAGLPKVQNLTDKRRKALAHRLQECGGIEGWQGAMARVASSDFLTGKKVSWRCDFDFILQASSFTKIMEGSYDNKPAPQPKQSGYSAQDALRGLYGG
jgi:uncharacterized protein YdaU (DUF1376 family)